MSWTQIRPLAHRGGDPLHARRAYVSHREHPGDARLHEIRPPRERPLRFGQLVRAEVGAGLDEALLVEDHAALDPRGVRIGTGQCRTGCGSDASPVLPIRHDSIGPARAGRRPRATRSASACAARCSGCFRCVGSGSGDMLAARLGPRTTTCTRDAIPERKTAACPAELPPPRSRSPLPCTTCASMCVAL